MAKRKARQTNFHGDHFSVLPLTTALMLSLPLALTSNVASAADATWNGTTADYNTGTNWNTSAAPGSGDTATFDNTATNQSVTFSSSPISIGGWTFNSGNYDFTIGSGQHLTFDNAGIINNGANNVDSFAITNNGRLDFSGTSSASSGSLSTTITTNSGGTTYIGDTASGDNARFYMYGTGSLDISGLTNSGTTVGLFGGSGDIFLGSKNLTFGGTSVTGSFSGVIQDGGSGGGTGGSLTKGGSASILTLSGANTYTGGTTINSGTVLIGNGSAFGTGDVTMASGANIYIAGDYTVANNFGLNGNATFNIANGSSSTLSGIFSDSGVTPGTLQKVGVGTLTLTGNNSYTGGTTLSTGPLFVGNNNALGTGDVTMAAGTTLGFASGTFTLANNFGLTGDPTFFVDTGNTDTISGVISDSGATPGILEKTGGGTLVLTSVNTYSGGTVINAGTLNVAADSGLGDSAGDVTLDGGTLQWGAAFDSARDITLNSGGGTFDTSSYSSTLSGVISGDGAFTKKGTGTLTLSGVNTFTGDTTINAGNLVISGSLASSQIAASGGALRYIGSATAGSATLTSTLHNIDFYDNSTAANAIIIDNWSLGFHDSSSAGSANITNGQYMDFSDSSTAGNATIINNHDLSFANTSTADNATITNNDGASTNFFDTASGGTARFILNGTGYLDLSGLASSGTTVGSIEGDGFVYLGSKTITVGGNNLDTTFSGTIQDTGGYASDTGGSLIKKGTGTLTLSGTNAYTGGTTINGGLLGIGNDDALGTGDVAMADGTGISITGNYTIANNFGLTGDAGFNIDTGYTGTISGIISDSSVTPGVLNKTGAGTLTLTGANTYTGGTTVTSGALSVGNNSALGTGDVTMAEGTTVDFTGDYTFSNNFGLTGDPTFFVDTGNTVTLSGVISDTTPGTGTAGVVEKTGDGTLVLSGVNTYSGGTIINAGTLNVSADSGLGDTSGGLTLDGGTLQWGAEFSSARDITLGSGGGTFDVGSSYIIDLDGVISGDGSLTKTGTGIIVLNGDNTYTGTTTAGGGLLLVHGAFASSQITTLASGEIQFTGTTTAGSATITNNGTTDFYNDSTAGSATITTTSGGSLVFADSGSAGNATITTDSGGSTYIAESGSGGTARFIMNGGLLDTSFLSVSSSTAGSIEGDGDIYLGSNNLTVGSNNLSTEFSGIIHDGGANGGTGGSLTKEGTGNLIFSNDNTYTGATTVNGGTLSVNGSLGNTSLITVNSGGTLGGTGAVSTTMIASGGTLAPGNSIGTITVVGNLTLASGSTYAVEVSPSAADRTNVIGSATIAGNLTTSFASGTYTTGTQYTLINSIGALSGTFANVSSTNAPYGFAADISYDPNNVFLTLTQYLDPDDGQIYADGTTTAISDERLLRNAVLDHLHTPSTGSNIWGAGFGGYSKFHSATTIAHHHSGGIAGFDVPLGHGIRAGLAAAYASSDTSSSTAGSLASGSATSDSGHVLAYASWSQGPLALRGGTAFGWGSRDITRYTPSQAATNQSSRPFETKQVFADASYSFSTADASLEPHVGLDWTHASNGSFLETGTSATIFSGPGTDTSAGFTTLGLRICFADMLIGSFNVTPSLDLGWRHGFHLPRPEQSLTLNNTGLTVTADGVPLARNALTAKLGADITLTPALRLNLGYDGFFSGHAQDNAVTAELNWSF